MVLEMYALSYIFLLMFTAGNDAWDPDRLVQCPYDPNHMIRQSRFPYHVLKCKKVGLMYLHLLSSYSFHADARSCRL